MFYNPFTAQEILNFIFFVSICVIGNWVLIKIFTPRDS